MGHADRRGARLVRDRASAGRRSADYRHSRPAPAARRRVGLGARASDGRDQSGRSQLARIGRRAAVGRESDGQPRAARLSASSRSRHRIHRLHRADLSGGRRGGDCRPRGDDEACTGVDRRRAGGCAARPAGVLLVHLCDRCGRGLRVARPATAIDSGAAQYRPSARRHVESGQWHRPGSRGPVRARADCRRAGGLARGSGGAGRLAAAGRSGMAGRDDRGAARAIERGRPRHARTRGGRAGRADGGAAALRWSGHRQDARRGRVTTMVSRPEPGAEAPDRGGTRVLASSRWIRKR